MMMMTGQPETASHRSLLAPVLQRDDPPPERGDDPAWTG
jgi:hypothetical protein